MRNIKIKINPLFLILAAYLIYKGRGLLLLVYVVTVILHELAHAVIAKTRGYTLSRINLMPYGAVIEGSIGEMAAYDEVIISLAGPLFNLLTALFFTALFWVFPSTYYFTAAFVTANLVTAVFNLLPAFPLDGGRVLLALLSNKFQRDKALKAVRIIGIVFAFLFGALFFISAFFGLNLTLALVCVFLISGNLNVKKQDNYIKIISRLNRKRRLQNGLKIIEIMVEAQTPLNRVLRMLNANYYYNIIIVDESFKRLKTISEDDFESLLEKNNILCPIISALNGGE
jgi:stage IV sporulation protein FB